MVCEVIDENKTKLLEQRYDFSIGTLLNEVRKRLKWADGKTMKNEMDAQVKYLEEIKYQISFLYSISYSNFSVLMIVHRKVQHQNRMSHRPQDHLRLLLVMVSSK